MAKRRFLNFGRSTKGRRPRRPGWQRWSIRLAGLILLYTVLGFWILPWTVRNVVVSQLKKALHREVQLHQIRFNPYTFMTDIKGLAIRDLDGQPLAGWDLVRVDFAFTSLFHGPWRFQEIIVVGPRLRIQINPDYSLNFSDLLEGSPAPDPSTASGSIPQVVVDRLFLGDLVVSYTDLTSSKPFHREINLSRIESPRLSTQPGHTNHFKVQGSMEGGETLDWQGNVTLDPITAQGRFQLNGLQITNYAALYQDFLNLNVAAGRIDLAVEHQVVLAPKQPQARLTDTLFSLANLKLHAPEAETNLLELDQLSVHAVDLDVTERRAEVEEVRLDGLRINVRRRANQQVNVLEASRPPPVTARTPGSALFAFEALTNARALFLDRTRSPVGILHRLLLTNSTLEALDEVPAQPVRFALTDLAAAVREVSNLPGAAPTGNVSFRWQTNGTFQLQTQARFDRPSLDAKIDLKDWSLGMLDPYIPTNIHVELKDSRLSFGGVIHLEAPPEQAPQGRFEGQVALENAHTRHALDENDILKWDAFRLEGIAAQLHPLNVGIKRVLLDGVELWIILTPTGQLNLLTAVDIRDPLLQAPDTPPDLVTTQAAPPPKDPTPSAEIPGAARLPPVQIASIQLTNANLHLADQMTGPDIRITVHELRGEVNDLSSTNLMHADLALEGGLPTGGKFRLAGNIRPTGSSEASNMRLITQDIDLTPGTAYFERYLGYELDRGALSTELVYTLQQDALAGSNHVVLDRFTLGRKVDSPNAFKAPVKLGLAVLQDRNGRITLDVPITGSLDDPQFDLTAVISGAFANVFTRIATSPFGVLGSMFGSKEEDLQWVEFEAGQAEIPPKMVKRLATVTDILFERPGLQLQVVGLTDPNAEESALRQRVLTETLRERKWQSLTPQQGEAAPLDELELGEDEFAELGRQLYQEKRGQRDQSVASAQPTDEVTPFAPGSVPQTQPETSNSAIARSAESPAARTNPPRPRQIQQGAARMMQLARESRKGPAPSPPTGTDGSASSSSPAAPGREDSVPPQQTADALSNSPPEPSWDIIKSELLADIQIRPADWESLATARAERVRRQILEGDRIEPERLSISISSEGRKPRSAVELELR